MKLRSEKDNELHFEEVKKRRNQILIGDKEDKLSDLEEHKKDKLEELKTANYHDREDLVNRMELTFDEIIDV